MKFAPVTDEQWNQGTSFKENTLTDLMIDDVKILDKEDGTTTLMISFQSEQNGIYGYAKDFISEKQLLKMILLAKSANDEKLTNHLKNGDNIGFNELKGIRCTGYLQANEAKNGKTYWNVKTYIPSGESIKDDLVKTFEVVDDDIPF